MDGGKRDSNNTYGDKQREAEGYNKLEEYFCEFLNR